MIGLVATACGSFEASAPAETTGAEPPAAASVNPPSAKHERTAKPPSSNTANSAGSFGTAPEAPTGPLAPEVAEGLETIFGEGLLEGVALDTIRTVSMSKDPRVAWVFSDLLRFVQVGRLATDLLDGFEQLTGTELDPAERTPGRSWKAVTDYLIAWDLPAPPGYVELKQSLYSLIEPGWEPFFADVDANIDWRWISWGGVQIDDRELGDPAGCPKGCIPALDDPVVTSGDGGYWYPELATVFGLVVGDEARAYPKNIMEIHEMVNDTIGGRRIGMPYCTLCGSAQAYFTDNVGDDDLVLRTSGLLSRSNKVMYDLGTKSVFNTFTGEALSGPLQDQGVMLEPVTVVTTTWGEWRAGHPDSTIVTEDAGIGRDYPADPLRGRDDDGPIFPIGNADTRLPIQEPVVALISPGGSPLAFPAAAARESIDAGKVVELTGVQLVVDGGGLRAVDANGKPLASHQAFWFAWSQFHPDTALWTPLS